MRFLRRWVFSRMIFDIVPLCFFLVVGAGLLGAGLDEFQWINRVRQAGTRVSGVVAGKWTKSDSEGSARCYLGVGYETATGEELTGVARVSCALYDAKPLGSDISVWYEPAMPARIAFDLAERDNQIVTLFLVGAAMIAIPGYLFGGRILGDIRRFRIYDRGVDGEARIVQFLQRDGGEGQWLWGARWEGLTPDRRTIKGQSRWRWVDTRDRFPLGATIAVRYLPDDPSQSVWQDDLAGAERDGPDRRVGVS